MRHLNWKFSALLWAAATVITLAAAIYQKATGPTYPVRGKAYVAGSAVNFELMRSADSDGDAVMQIAVANAGVTGEVRWKRYKSFDPWMTQPLARSGGNLSVVIPRQPPAGKVEYRVFLIDHNGYRTALTMQPVVIRFKGHVPLFILLPHIFCMFFSMLVGTRCGLEAAAKGNQARGQAIVATVLLVLGGIILGPIVQKYAFGAFWTGWPFGHDLTDNKTAVALLFWIIALWQDLRHNRGRAWYMVAAVMQLIVYSFPHSMLGSEIDYTKKF
jgi:hypothetical protein